MLGCWFGRSRSIWLVLVVMLVSLLVGGVGVARGAALGQTSDFATLTASSNPFGIAPGPDGNLWFTEDNVSKIGVINPVTHAINEFATPTASSGPLGHRGRPRRQPLVHRVRRRARSG